MAIGVVTCLELSFGRPEFALIYLDWVPLGQLLVG